MRTTLTLFAFLLSAPLFAQQDREVRRIFDDINFISYQLTLDTKAQYQSPIAKPLAGHSTTRHGKESAPVTDAPTAPVSRVFTAQNIWADLKVTVLDYGNRMQLQVTSSKPAQGWMLQEKDANHILFRGNIEKNALNFQVSIPRQYSPDLGLTVIVTGPDGQNPAFIALK